MGSAESHRDARSGHDACCIVVEVGGADTYATVKWAAGLRAASLDRSVVLATMKEWITL